MTITAGRVVFSALAIISFFSSVTTHAQSVAQLAAHYATQATRSQASAPTGQNPVAEPADQKKTADASVEARVPPAVVPPAPNVTRRKPNSVSIPASVADLGSDYEEHPVSGISVGSRFGIRIDPFTRRRKFHSGVDIKARWGDPVGASYAGTVSFVGWSHGYGNMVVVDHGGGIATHYAHLSSFDVEVGDHVERGTVIGRAGSTGRATSPHLHYELRVDGAAINPFSALVLDADSPYFKQSRAEVPPAEEAPKDKEPKDKVKSGSESANPIMPDPEY